jgi:transposase
MGGRICGSWPLLVIIFESMETPITLFPNVSEFQLDSVERDEVHRALTFVVTSTARGASCPECGQLSHRYHSRYWRTVADLPWAEYTVQVRVALRKWHCRAPDCRRRVFCERLPRVTRPRWRRTIRLVARQHQLAVALGGAPGARLSASLGCPVSRNTLLRLLRRTPGPAPPTPRVLGVDDWAYRKGQRYGTVLIDVERRTPIALLPDREAPTLSQWLQTHPGIAVICRDRAGAYADGARSGAPDAVQVADRFHLLRNVADAVQLVFAQHRKMFKTVTAGPLMSVATQVIPSTGEVPVKQEETTLPSSVPPTAEVPPISSQPRAERYKHVCQLAQQGWPFTAIAKAVGLHRKTVSLYVRGVFSPRRPSRSILDPYKPYLLARWNAGYWTGTQLWQEIQQQGYRGKRTTVLCYIGRLRQAAGVAPRTRIPQLTAPPVVDPSVGALTPRQAAWLVFRHPEKSTESDASLLHRLSQLAPALAEAIALGQAFARLLRSRCAEHLEEWLTQAAQSALAPFQRLAKSFRRDLDAIRAGVTLPWSTGPVEGHINRLKLVKRQMFGRAKLDLLASRFLARPQPLPQQKIHCTEMKPLPQQAVMNQMSDQVTELHPLATLTLKHEDHQKWP